MYPFPCVNSHKFNWIFIFYGKQMVTREINLNEVMKNKGTFFLLFQAYCGYDVCVLLILQVYSSSRLL